MLKFILKRLFMMIPVLLGAALVVFTMLHVSPGRAADFILGEKASEEDKAHLEHQMGLDQPFLVQYTKHITNVLKGDMGTSWSSRRPVMGELLARFPSTLKLAVLCVGFSAVIGVTLGIISAIKQYSFIDSMLRVTSIVGVSMPAFWEGLMLIILFSVVLGWLPPSGFSSWRHYILPVITIGTGGACSIMRMTRSSMLEAIRQDYIRTARAKGQSERIVIWRHALKNALIPVITMMGLSLGGMLGGMAISETVFAIPGIGKLIVDAIAVKNAPVVQGGILFIAFCTSIVNLVTDVIYAFVDPRIRSQYVRRKEKRIEKGVR